MANLETYAEGTVIYDKDTNEYYADYNTWVKQLRKAKVYHSPTYIQYVFDKFKDRNLSTCHVTIQASIGGN